MKADFSAWAKLYAAARPRYPAALFEHLVGLCERHDLAWDCATGSGQAAVSLAEHFARVVATDMSEGQLREAPRHPRIDYRVATAERSGLPDASVDLVTVAAALHWFDREAFAGELRRVVRPGGVAAAWTYHAAYIDDPVGERLRAFYFDVVRSCFPPGFELVDDRYASIHLPGTELATPEFAIESDWTRDELIAFVRSWSGTQAYVRKHGADPTEALARELTDLYPDEHGRQRLRWPLYLRVSRL